MFVFIGSVLLIFLNAIVPGSTLAGGPIRGDTIPKLLSIIKSTNFGASKTVLNPEIISMIENIGAENRDKTKLMTIQGSWELLWTTEKEILFFAKSGLFGKPVTTISQDVDFKEGRLVNSIQFEGEREFSVTGKITEADQPKRRTNFEFEKARLSIPPLPSLTLPPVGKGYFDTIYANEKYRFSVDIRGDYQISRRIR